MTLVGGDGIEAGRSQGGSARADAKARRLLSVGYSPLARKIILFNLLGMVLLVAGVLLLNPFRTALEAQQRRDLTARVENVAGGFDLLLAAGEPLTAAHLDRAARLLTLKAGQSAQLFDAS